MKTTAEMLEDRYGMAVDFGDAVKAEGTVAGILARGTQRHFTDEPVPEDLLKVLLACAQSAPTKSDLQQYSVIVVRDRERLAKLGKLNKGLELPTKAPVFMAWCADMRRLQRLAEIRGHDHQNNNLDTFMNGVIDAALAMQSFMCAAEGAGLGCCPISQIRNNLPEVSEILNIPPGVFPIAGFSLGWSQFPTPRISMRLPQDAVVHWETYDDSDLPELVEGYDRRRHAKNPIPPEKQRHTDKYGAAEYCPWSENVTRQLSLPERPGFSAFLKSHGYDLD
jgi:nitroreductase